MVKGIFTLQYGASFSYQKCIAYTAHLYTYIRDACKFFACHTPQQEVDEDCDGKEGAASTGVATQEEDEVAEKTKKHQPHHMQPKEQVQGVKATCNCAEVLYACGQATCQW